MLKQKALRTKAPQIRITCILIVALYQTPNLECEARFSNTFKRPAGFADA